MAAKTVTVIPQTINPITRLALNTNQKRRVAGYARVSTDSDEQFTSYEAQIDYYTQYIKNHADWEFVKVYTDEGITGTNTRHREGFNLMIEDALAGKIDLIVTKSVSRFARNTVDSLVTVRKLKEKGVEVFFEKENIYTLDSKGELLITIMSSLAQEESRSISENVTWGHRKRFADGKILIPYANFLGYRKGADGLPEIVEEEAEIIRRIFKMFMLGETSTGIARQLTAEGIPTPRGKSKWRCTTIDSILQNEKYKGDALLQKTYTIDFLTKKKKDNEGEIPQYYVANSHPAIIPPQEFDLVQAEITRRKAIRSRYSGGHVFATKLICGDCGCFYGQKTWHSTSKYKCVIWQCTNKYNGEAKCNTPHLYEHELKEMFIKAYNAVTTEKQSLIEDCRLMQSQLTETGQLEAEIDELQAELDLISDLIKQFIAENASKVIDQEEYQKQYEKRVEHYDTVKLRMDTLTNRRKNKLAKAEAIGAFMFELIECSEILSEFDEKLWQIAVTNVTISNDNSVTFNFQNGTKYTIQK